MEMFKQMALAVLMSVLALSLVACGGPEPVPPAPDQGSEAPADGGAAGLRLAPGLYDLEGGKVQALGTLEYRDIEGGLWAIIDTTAAAGAQGVVAAVIANADAIESELKALEGKSVIATGTRLEGASIRMAGPEIEVEKIEEFSDTGGIAE